MKDMRKTATFTYGALHICRRAFAEFGLFSQIKGMYIYFHEYVYMSPMPTIKHHYLGGNSGLKAAALVLNNCFLFFCAIRKDRCYLLFVTVRYLSLL